MLALTWLCPHGDAVGMELGGVGTEVYKIWGGRLSKKEHKITDTKLGMIMTIYSE